MDYALTSDDLTMVDEGILRRDILPTLRYLTGLPEIRSLRNAIDFFHDRYAVLRVTRPKEFVCGPQEYWEGVYS